ncbi:MAG TPA: nucleotide pyrophosphatase/phosphodiesterase family protein [Polyangia bacterium]|nr:nucleotide pyrophosphatase/phosphodiesterase family protein [Polyangia bacterium]
MSHPPLVVINVVGLTPAHLGADTPNLTRLADAGFACPLEPVLPAVTCTAQATMLTGLSPRDHGVVANGWYFRDLAEPWLWRQSNHLVTGEKVWETARRSRPGLRCAKMFWWFNMYSSADVAVTPRPIYPADGRKLPGIYTAPARYERSLQETLGPFPLFHFWGPAADIRSTKWIADASRVVFDEERPDLTLVYLPHLDYNMQRLGPDDPRVRQDVRAVDQVAGQLIDHVRGAGAEVLVVSEYGIEAATGVVRINQVLREAGLIEVRETLGWEMLDAGASRAFAVADHQLAHVYVKDPADMARVTALLRGQGGIERLYAGDDRAEIGLDHPRSGEIVALAAPGFWFAYYYWLDEARAPDFARTVDIHRKPGYDPVELFLDPDLPLVKGRIAWTLLKKKLGFRTLMSVISLRPELVKGTHGRPPASPDVGPLLISSSRDDAADSKPMAAVKDLILRRLLR